MERFSTSGWRDIVKHYWHTCGMSGRSQNPLRWGPFSKDRRGGLSSGLGPDVWRVSWFNSWTSWHYCLWPWQCHSNHLRSFILKRSASHPNLIRSAAGVHFLIIVLWTELLIHLRVFAPIINALLIVFISEGSDMQRSRWMTERWLLYTINLHTHKASQAALNESLIGRPWAGRQCH